MSDKNITYTVEGEGNSCLIINEIYCIYEARNVNQGIRWCEKGHNIGIGCTECPDRTPERRVSTMTWTSTEI